MPWKECSVMDERLRLVSPLLDGEPMTEVCRAFGISRKTGYKIFDRYKEHGLEALTDRSRRPIRSANQLPGPIESLSPASRTSRTGARARSASSSSGEALDMRRPAEVYSASPRAYGGLPELTYPLHDRDVVVTACGRICMHRKRVNISTVLAGQRLGIKEIDDGIWIVSFMRYDLGFIDLEQKTLQT